MTQTPVTCINGTLVPAATAALPVSDRLVRFGDGIFETIRVEQGVPYQWELHLQRLQAGLAALRITPPAADFTSAARAMLHTNAAREGFLRVAVSRGIGSRGYLPDAAMQPNWIMEWLPPVPAPAAPFKLWVSDVTRPPLSSLPVNHKLAHGIGSTLALLDARDHGCDEALMLSADGKLCEAASANIFWVANEKLYTPALETGCLAGTTRAALMRVTDTIEVVAELGALHNADAIFLTNTRLGIWPANATKFKVMNSHSHYMLNELIHFLATDKASYIAAHRAEWAAA